MNAPDKPGYWWVTGPGGRQLLLMELRTETRFFAGTLFDGVWTWFLPSPHYWHDWVEATAEEVAAKQEKLVALKLVPEIEH